MSDPIASLHLVLAKEDGSEIAVRARIGAPYRVAAGEWACAVALEGIDRPYPDIHGEGALQALALALRLLQLRVRHVLERGDRLLDAETREPLDREHVDAMFGRND